MGLKTYSSTALDNTDVSGVAGTSIAEDNSPSTINNAIRQLMADLAADLVIGGDFAWELVSGGALTRVALDAPFDGAVTTFTMSSLLDGSSVSVGGPSQVRLVLGGVRQEPDVDYSVDGTALNFFEAPLTSDTFFALATVGQITTPAVEEYRLYEDGAEHMFVRADPSSDPTQPTEEALGLHLLEVNTP